MQKPSVTTIASTAKVKDSRTTINDNFDGLATQIGKRAATFTGLTSTADLVGLTTATPPDIAQLANGDLYMLSVSDPSVLTHWVKVSGGTSNAYVLPNGGIPKTDLATAVQKSIDKASGSATRTLYPEDYNAKGDVVNITDAAVTASSPNLSSAGQYTFTSADIGKLVAVEGAVTAGTTNPLGVLLSTIQSVSNGVATLGANATVTKTGANCSFGTDDTTALTNFFAALSSAPRGTIYRGVLSSQYATSAAVPDGGGNYQLSGTAMQTIWEMDHGAPIPVGPSVQLFPYIAGACIVAFTTGITGIITSGGNGQFLKWVNVGLRFAKPFSGTGHGHYAVGPLVSGQSYHKTSLVQSIFDNTAVYGHDGSSYGLYHLNSYRNQYNRNMTSGGGGLMLGGDNANFAWGNHTIIDPEVHLFIGGSAHCLSFGGSGTGMTAPQTNPALIRPNFFISNLTSNFYPNSSPATNAQKFLSINTATCNGFTVISPDFESPSVANTTFDWATATSKGAGGVGWFFDTGHYMNGIKPPQYRVLSDQNLHEFYSANTRSISAATDTMPAGWASATYSLYDTTSNSIVVTLPTGALTPDNGVLYFKKTSADANTVTLNASGGNKFWNSSGPTSLTLTAQGDGYQVVWNGNFLIPFKA